jgi:hypothetical protein
MRIFTSSFARRFLIITLFIFTGIIIRPYATSVSPARVNDGFPASLIGVHHLGADYSIYKFHINKSIGDSVGEGGGGGSMVCCMTLPRQWDASLSVDVRWAVDHIIRSVKTGQPDTTEVEGIYHAQVPVEKYTTPGDFYVHFFPNGRIRVAVTSMDSDSDEHPIRSGDMQALRTATAGKRIEALFTEEEVAERRKAAYSAREKYGDWR